MSDPQKEASDERPAPAETSPPTEETTETEEISADADPDLDNRVLCPDGSCIGVIGPDGLCKVCGKHGELPVPKPERPAADSAPSADSAPFAGPAADTKDSADESADLRDRRLCSDGNCIGVIGTDDRCKVCGKPYTGEPEL
jgi:hypothetical protein